MRGEDTVTSCAVRGAKRGALFLDRLGRNVVIGDKLNRLQCSRGELARAFGPRAVQLFTVAAQTVRTQCSPRLQPAQTSRSG